MNWRDSLRPASFNDIDFLVESHESSIGRRTARHEYPTRDEPYIEDLGRKAREFTIEAYIAQSTRDRDFPGSHYFVQRNALMNEIEKEGPGKLVHPYLGEKIVSVTECRVKESTQEGGLVRFSITFIESGLNVFPVVAIDSGAAVNAACDAAATASQNDLANNFSVTKTFAFIADSASSKLFELSKDIRKQTAAIATIGAKITTFNARVNTFGASLSSLMLAPKNLASDVMGIFIAVRGVTTDVKSALATYRSLFGFGSDDAAVPQTTATRKLQETNRVAMNNLIQRAATIEAARSAADLDYTSFDEATEVRDAIAIQLDTLMESADDDDVYQKLLALRAAMVRDITTRGADLARIVKYTPRTTLPALVIAHQLYGDATRADEIVARNRIAHPGFVPGGRALEVLADG